MIRKSLMTLLLGVTLAGAGATIYAQEVSRRAQIDVRDRHF